MCAHRACSPCVLTVPAVHVCSLCAHPVCCPCLIGEKTSCNPDFVLFEYHPCYHTQAFVHDHECLSHVIVISMLSFCAHSVIALRGPTLIGEKTSCQLVRAPPQPDFVLFEYHPGYHTQAFAHDYQCLSHVVVISMPLVHAYPVIALRGPTLIWGNDKLPTCPSPPPTRYFFVRISPWLSYIGLCA